MFFFRVGGVLSAVEKEVDLPALFVVLLPAVSAVYIVGALKGCLFCRSVPFLLPNPPPSLPPSALVWSTTAVYWFA